MAKAQKTSSGDGSTAGGLLAAALRRAVLRRQEQDPAASALPVAKGAALKRKPARKPAKADAVSPLAPETTPDLPPLAGVELATGAAGIRYQGRTDVMIAAMPQGTTVAGVFTRSTMPGAPIVWCKDSLAEGKREPTARLLVVNAGNANVFTGRAGMETVESVAASGAQLAKCRKREVFQASTGVIGEPMPKGKIEAILPALYGKVSGSTASWAAAARAIMTTDTYPKLATRRAKIGGATVTLNGIAKGSGMIAPDLGTMLAYIFTDAALPSEVLQTLLVLGVRDTFNAITVDSDTSTSDMVLLFATGKGPAHDKVERAGEPRLREFRAALHDLMGDLSRQVICDGEGATKLVQINVTGAASAKAARAIALAIANSPLVKTAIAASDANWGRIVAAIGKSGEAADRDKLAIKLGGLPVARNGARDPRYDEAKLSAYMKGKEIALDVDVAAGEGRAVIWTCDLTHRYIDINGSYRS